MSLRTLDAAQALALRHEFDAILDARTPAEFALDHIPAACNWPVLSDAERAEVGMLYRHSGSFAAKLVGARYVSRNIAALLEQHGGALKPTWSCLVYCWRGGKRSGALAHVLAEIGLKVVLLRGGYKAFRREVSQALVSLAASLRWRVVCGETGNGKSRLLQALTAKGEQVLDLELLANHRGSVLGLAPGTTQPSQKHFETLIWEQLRGFDSTRVVWVESESKKVGALQVPQELMEAMRAAPCVHLALDEALRVQLLLSDYQHFIEDKAALLGRLQSLRDLRGEETIARWRDLVEANQWQALVLELLREHYDPIYRQSMHRHYKQLAQAQQVTLTEISQEAFAGLASTLAKEVSPSRSVTMAG